MKIFLILGAGAVALWFLWRHFHSGATRNPDGSVNYTSPAKSTCVWDPKKGTTVCAGGDLAEGYAGFGIGGAITTVTANPGAFVPAPPAYAPPPPPPPPAAAPSGTYDATASLFGYPTQKNLLVGAGSF